MDPGLPVANAGEIAPKVPGIDKATVRQRLEFIAHCRSARVAIIESIRQASRWKILTPVVNTENAKDMVRKAELNKTIRSLTRLQNFRMELRSLVYAICKTHSLRGTMRS